MLKGIYYSPVAGSEFIFAFKLPLERSGDNIFYALRKSVYFVSDMLGDGFIKACQVFFSLKRKLNRICHQFNLSLFFTSSKGILFLDLMDDSRSLTKSSRNSRPMSGSMSSLNFSSITLLINSFSSSVLKSATFMLAPPLRLYNSIILHFLYFHLPFHNRNLFPPSALRPVSPNTFAI